MEWYLEQINHIAVKAGSNNTWLEIVRNTLYHKQRGLLFNPHEHKILSYKAKYGSKLINNGYDLSHVSQRGIFLIRY